MQLARYIRDVLNGFRVGRASGRATHSNWTVRDDLETFRFALAHYASMRERFRFRDAYNHARFYGGTRTQALAFVFRYAFTLDIDATDWT